ncbi:MAG: hypothetical protein RL730_1494, partial [Actinomycetota bacterium]
LNPSLPSGQRSIASSVITVDSKLVVGISIEQ